MEKKRVYLFGNGKAEGNAKMREQLGGKGANLAEMNLIGVPVPPGFTITTDVCNEYYEVGHLGEEEFKSFEEGLNEYASSGWELNKIFKDPKTPRLYLVFKREKMD